MPNQTLHKPFSISTSERHSGDDVIVFWEKRGVLSTAVHFAVEGMSVFPIPQKKQNKKSLRCPVAEGFFITKRRANQWQKVFFMASKSLR